LSKKAWKNDVVLF